MLYLQSSEAIRSALAAEDKKDVKSVIECDDFGSDQVLSHLPNERDTMCQKGPKTFGGYHLVV